MESKKLQQLQQVNSHLAPQKKLAMSYQTMGDYRTSAHSPVFQNHMQYHHQTNNVTSNFTQIPGQNNYHQSPTSSASHSTPIDIQPQGHTLMKPTNPSLYQAQAQQPQYGHATDKIYQSPIDRAYQMSTSASRSIQYQGPTAREPTNPVTALQAQYQQLQQAKVQAQIQTQNEAMVHQQRTFAMRQQMNPPVPQSHYHMSQSQSIMSSQQFQQAPQKTSASHHQQRVMPPSTLNLSSQFQPASGPLKLNSSLQDRREPIYQQKPIKHTQLMPAAKSMPTSTPATEPSPVYIQQNHPGHVVNQACQTQISGALGNKGSTTTTKTPSSEDSSGKSPSHDAHNQHQQLERKKSSGSGQALKLPLTKRPPSAPVTISGWLYKQGSEGLKVWRKRWFVLAEYCMYYYKGPEEEKVLGAILLPSYKVSACLPEDKIYRKFAFKCEHTNMRTYWLAAENVETMVQWVKALTAATMMQGSSESDQTSQPSVSSLNHSGENSDSGIHTYQSQQSNKVSVPTTLVTPASDGGAQPLYANAPPKPRRITDGGYSSPSPENSIDKGDSGLDSMPRQQHSGRRSGGVMSPTLHQMQRSQHHAIYDTQSGVVTSTLRPNMPDNVVGQFQQMSMDASNYNNDYGRAQQQIAYNQIMELEEQMRNQHRAETEDIYGERELYMQKVIQQRYPSQAGQGPVMTYPNVERRTPDAYGRSKNRPFADYEDIYNVAQQQHQQQQSDLGEYRRPMSPPSYDNAKHVPPMPTRYTPNHLEPSSTRSVARPHSADFLEYEARVEMAAAAAAAVAKPDPVRAPRPKSSLDINRTPDNYYYSEASYAEKMRQSALYLQKPQAQQQQQFASPESSPAGYNRHHNEASPYNAQSGMHTIGYENPYERAYKRNELLNETINQGSSSIPRMSRSATNNGLNNNYGSPGGGAAKEYQQRAQHLPQSEQFLRSASARLPKRGDDEGNATPSTSNTLTPAVDGERKREESMKRLLEWKQRMLQSPLTRKGIQQGSPSSVMAKLGSNPMLVPNATTGSAGGIQRSRSETHANAGGYNSYSSDDEASISVRNVRNLPKVNLTVKPDPSDPITLKHPSELTNASSSYYSGSTAIDRNYYMAGSGGGGHDYHPHHRTNSSNPAGYDTNASYRERDSYYPMRKSGSRAEIDMLERETSSQIRNLDMSAGDLLSRTHEELVLLLIQLRRQNSQTARAIEQCCTDIHKVQNRIRTSDGLTRAESIQRLDYLKQHLLDLEKQYEKSKPLVNLVDNMVKLGSLYRSNENAGGRQSRQQRPESVTLDRLEFNQRIQERRMLEEEQKQWDRLSPNHNELQSKVRQLYDLDQLLQEESGTLQNLQKDKEDLERALGGLRARLQDNTGPPMVLEAAKKQQHVLERELSRVHQLLAENSKKLEQTVAGNARLEQELLVLRQKLQASRGSRGSQGALSSNHGANDSIQYASTTTALLESELKRVQQLVGGMQRQRQELSSAVKQLTENSNRLYQEIGSKESSHIKKRSNSTGWIETDIDSFVSHDRTVLDRSNLSTPLYVDTSSANSSGNLLNCSTSSKLSEFEGKGIRNYHFSDNEAVDTSGLDSDEFLDTNPFANLTNQEKQEIKTVRIVKRESERRQRDRERSTNASQQNLDQVTEEDHQSRSQSLPRTYNDLYDISYSRPASNNHSYGEAQIRSLPLASSSSSYSSTNQIKYTDYYAASSQPSDKNSNYSSYLRDARKQQPPQSALRNKTESMQSLTKSISDLSPGPVFQSEAARQIITEMSAGSASEDNNTEKVPASHKHKRAVPREKRRHYTAPNNVNKVAMEKVQTENDMNRNNTNWRARDDLDMEVALRPRSNAPDVVRSALANGDKISENTIDKLFGAPNKIVIPERYIPEKTPELSPEEKKRRQEKVEAIKKMLSEAPMNDAAVSTPPSKITAEKKQREHLLQLNQILAQQVMQMSKIVAENAMANRPAANGDYNTSTSEEERSSSPSDPLPIYQQRDNFFT